MQCIECKEIWASKSKSGRHSLMPGHRLAFVCVPCGRTFAAAQDFVQHQAATGHKIPEELVGSPVSSSTGLSRAGSLSRAGTPSPSPSLSPGEGRGERKGRDEGGAVDLGTPAAMEELACPVCSMPMENYEKLSEVRRPLTPPPYLLSLAFADVDVRVTRASSLVVIDALRMCSTWRARCRARAA